MYSLFLYETSKSTINIQKSKLIDYLIKHHFIQNKNGLLISADNFMSLLTFMGCSPTLGQDIETSITLSITQNPLHIGGQSIQTIQCPHCKSKILKPDDLVTKFNSTSTLKITCCNKEIAFEQINWRRSAGKSSVFIQISNIFPKEALPSDELFHLLKNFSGTNWNYFYSKVHKFS